MKKRLCSMLLCLCIVAGMPMSVLASRSVGQYGVDIEGPSYVTTENPFYPTYLKQCTWYCWGRAKEKCGFSLPCRGNAETWYSGAENAGLPVGTEPKANSIAVFRGVGSKTVGVGHVVFVEKIEGTTAYCTEGNYIYSPEYHETTFDINAGVFYAGDSNWEQRLIGYIYLETTPMPVSDSNFEFSGRELVKYKGNGGDVTIPNGVVSIGYDAFKDCTNLTSVTIPNSVTSIGYSAFAGCTGLTSVIIGSGVAGSDWYAFGLCENLAAIQVDANNQNYVSVDGVLFTKDMKTLVAYPGGKQGAYTIPSSVTNIREWAFFDCSNLTSVTISNGVNSIKEGTFTGCRGLTSVTIPNSVTSIEIYAFQACTGLPSVTIPDSITSIEGEAFYGCEGLKDVYYTGTEAQWKAIKRDRGLDFMDDLTNATIHYNSAMPEQPTQPAEVQAQPTNDSLLLDGQAVEAAAYKIAGSNYFKLRDVAALLTGTPKQFSVGYDSAAKSAVITTGQPYQLNGTELKGKPTAGGTAAVSSDSVIVNGQKAELTVYKINGENYFKLRDLGRALDFNVGWSKDKGMYIDSGRSYTDAD